MDEFNLISRLFSPLARTKGAAGLADDVAELEHPGDQPIIVTTDALVEGVHFLRSDPVDTVAGKLIRVNVSDIIAKGAHPFAASLALMWPKGRCIEDLSLFAEGLGKELSAWSVDLIGGDTTSTPGPLSLSMTMHGACLNPAGPVRRNGARPGDLIVVTGVIGAGVLGLKAATGEIAGERAEGWLQHYRVPEIQDLEIADLVAEVANASIDVSDGLVADAGHICSQSHVKARIYAPQIPLADPAADLFEQISGGDDYQVLFTCSRDRLGALSNSPSPVTVIGEMVEGRGVDLIGANGEEIPVSEGGWSHF